MSERGAPAARIALRLGQTLLVASVLLPTYSHAQATPDPLPADPLPADTLPTDALPTDALPTEAENRAPIAQAGGVQQDVADAATLGTTGADGTITYTPADFARFAPRTAADMIAQIPDFTLTESDDARGLGQASQNVLINGQRVSGKSSDAETALAAIAASSVQRIEVSDGARLNIPGLTGRVANVIVATTGQGLTMRYRWEGQQRRNIQDQITVGSVSASGRIGGSDVTLSLSNDNGLRRGGIGPETVSDANDALLLTRFERASFHADRPRLAGTLRRAFNNGSILNLNLAGELYYFRARIDGDVTNAATGALSDELFRQREDETFFEGGGDYDFALGGGRLKIIALQSYEHSAILATFTAQDRAPGSVAGGSRFARTVDEGESVVRAEYGWRGGGGDWQIAVEGAYNFLDNGSAFATLGRDGRFVDVALPGSDVFVDEIRTEMLLTRGWTLAPGVSLQTIIGGEYSQLRQTGALGQSRQFIRPKGSAALAWTVNPSLTLNAKLARVVGQLSFFDFTDAVDLQNGNTNSGNAQLVPEQTWRGEVELIRSLGPLGSVTIAAYGEAISDIVDQIPLGPTSEGVGNLPSARRWGARLTGTLLLDPLGIPGARINVAGEVRDSSVRDPVTNAPRRISEDLVRSWSVEWRHDIPRTQVAWGGAISNERYAPNFRLDQTTSNRFSTAFFGLFVEHKNVLGATVRLGLRNLLNGSDLNFREAYVGRRDGPVDFRERQVRRIHTVGVLTISGNF